MENKKLRKYDIPEDLRAAENEYSKLHKAGMPIPDDIMEKRREYARVHYRLRQDELDKKPRRYKYDIPEDLRAAYNEYCRLKWNGLAVPDNIMEKYREYARVYRLQRNGQGKKPQHTKHDIPEDLRAAVNEYRRLKRKGMAVPNDIAEKYRECYRLYRRANDIGPHQIKHDIPEDLRAANNEYVRLKRKGLAVPRDIMEKCRKYERVKYRLQQDEQDKKPRQYKYDIPEDLRAASNEYQKLKRKGLPIPDDIMEKCRKCWRLRNTGCEKEADGERGARDDGPAEP